MTTPQQRLRPQVARFRLGRRFAVLQQPWELLPGGSFGHTGFTGTSIGLIRTTRTFIILLTNSVHPRGREAR